MLPDLGSELSRQGLSPDTMLTLMGIRFDSLCDYGRHREITGVTYLDEWPMGVMVTAATFQTKAEIAKLLRGNVVLHVLPGPEVTGGSGERYRVFCGVLGDLSHSPRSLGNLKMTRDRLVECIEKSAGHTFTRLTYSAAQTPVSQPER